MSSINKSEAPQWYVIHTRPKQEYRASSNLAAWQVETLSPMIKVSCRNQYTAKTTYMAKPLFPSYLFARFKLSDLLHKIRFTRGVRDVVSFGGNPTSIDDAIIEIIQARIGKDGFIRLDEELRCGDEVLIKGGPLQGFIGVFEREVDGAGRVMILLKTISYQARTVVPKQMTKKLEARAVT